MAEAYSVVAPESLSGSGRRNDVGAVNDSIVEKGFVRERKWVSKNFGNNGGRKVNSLFEFCSRLHPWKFSCGFEDSHPWRWITGRLGLEEIFKGANGNGARSANIVKGTDLGRVLDLVDEILN